MKYTTTFEITNVPSELRKHIQVGQWVTACGAKGIWCGQRKSGTDVVCYTDRLPATADGAEMLAMMIRYGRG